MEVGMDNCQFDIGGGVRIAGNWGIFWAWAQDAVVYQIMGRFFGKNGGKRAVESEKKLCYNSCN